jgi:hypothetical protein
LHKGDGTLALVVWGERVSGGDEVRVTFAACHTVKIYDVSLGSSPVKVLTAVDAVPLFLTDHALILEVTD